jgi:hypothetical protein
MTRVLMWKELREQWIVWVSLALTVAAGSAALAQLLPQGRDRETALLLILWVAAYLYGSICGAQLLAGESEEGTQVFLDTLPATRTRLWVIKAGTGLVFLGAQILALAAILFAIARQGLLPSLTIDDVALLVLCGFVGYAWGFFCGSFCDNVLGTLGWSILLQPAAAVVFYLCVALPLGILRERPSLDVDPMLWQTAASVAAVFVITCSRTVYCQIDSLRKRAANPRLRQQLRPGWAVLFWLAWNQGKAFAAGMAILGVFAGFLAALNGILTWPLLTVFTGILCGVTTFSDEQRSGSFRFAGDQRLPLGRFWLVKCLVRLGTGAASAVLTALTIAALVVIKRATSLRGELQEIDVRLIRMFAGGNVVREPVLFLTLWLITGYPVGLLFGLLFRRPFVAAVVSVGVAYPLALIWLPSIVVCGSLSVWQATGVPIALLLATRLLMHPRAADSLLSWRVAGTMASTGIGSLLFLTFGLWYRTVEIPVSADAVDLAAFQSSIPTPEENTSGRLTAVALNRLLDLRRTAATAEAIPQPRDQVPGARPEQARTTFSGFSAQSNEVARRGWAAGDAALASWLDRMFNDQWVVSLSRAADKPPGVVIDARKVSNGLFGGSPLPELNEAQFACDLLVARGFQQQAEGHPEVYLDSLRVGLALARNLRNRTIIISVLHAARLEELLVRSVEIWLRNLDGRTDLLHRALKILQEYAAAPGDDQNEARKAQRLVVENTFADVRTILPSTPDSNRTLPGEQAGTELLRFSLQVPWEKVRLTRLLDGLASNDPVFSALCWSHSPSLVRLITHRFREFSFFRTEFPPAKVLCLRRGTLLQVALRLYQAENGKPAETLADLVPKYLSAIPSDPYDHRAFRYRLSRGEVLRWPPAELPISEQHRQAAGRTPPDPSKPEPSPTRDVPAGQGILWCVGEDGQDNGGHTQESPHMPEGVGLADVIFLVPPPPAKH